MLQPYTLGFHTTAIDGGNITTNTVRATSMYSGSVDAWKISTQHLASKSITAELLAVGPQFQFRTTAGGQAMAMNQDGSLSLPPSGLNGIDGRWVADGTRSYSAAQPIKTYAATFTNPTNKNCGIVFNLTDPYATTGQTGILVWMEPANGRITVYRCVGVTGYVSGTNYTGLTFTGTDRLVVHYLGSQGTPRMRVFLNGAEIGAGTMTDALLGPHGGAKGGCAGFLLSDQTIKVSEIIMGNQSVILEDGRVQAQHVDAVSLGASQVIISSIVGGINNGSTTINGGKITTNTIVADHINVATINAASGWIDALDARVIKARTIKVDRLEAKALNFINNFSATGTTVDWSSAGPLENVARGAVTVRAMKITTANDVEVISSTFDIDPNKSYQTKLSFKVGSESLGGTIYFGLNAYDKDGAMLPLQFLSDTGTWSDLGSNAYFFHRGNPVDGSWWDVTGFLMASDTQPQDAPPSPLAGQLNPYVAVNGVLVNDCQDRPPVMRLPPNAVKLRLRFLNYYNSGVSRTVWFANPSISEVGTGVINADSIRAGSLESWGNGTTGRYTTYNFATDTAYGFRLSHAPFVAKNKWNRDMTVQAEFGTTVLVRGYPLGPALAIGLQGFDIPPLDQLSESSRVFYRGNCSPSTRTAPLTPNINCLGVQGVWQNIAQAKFYVNLILRPSVASGTDNLDGMRCARVKMYRGTPAGAALIRTIYVPLKDRLYAEASEIHNANWSYNSFSFQDDVASGLLSSDSPRWFFLIAISNAYGWSDELWYSPNLTLGADWTPSTVSPITGAPPPGGGTGGSGGGGGCLPAGSTLLVYRDGMAMLIPIQEAAVGDFAIGYDDKTLRPIVSKISHTFCYENRDLYHVVTSAGTLTCSHDHRLALVSEDGSVTYPPARELAAGARVYWFNKQNYSLEPVRVLSSTPTGTRADVFHLTMEQGHVYIGSDFPAHNALKLQLLYD